MPSDHPDASRPDDSEPGLDIDAAFAEIVAHWEPSPPSADEEQPPVVVARVEPVPEPEPVPEAPVRDEEEHFVPPPPPPLPQLDPRRKVAWIGVVGAPVVGLLLVVLRLVVPGWVEVGLVAAFVGGFGYLVATMGSSPPDPWSGDDGAVL
jgi:hypothetical protein